MEWKKLKKRFKLNVFCVFFKINANFSGVMWHQIRREKS